MKNKTSSVLLVMVVLLASCSNNTKSKLNHPMTFSQIYQGNLDQITKIWVKNGSTGYEVVTTDSETIRQWVNQIKDVKFIPLKDQSDRSGYRYWIKLFSKNKKVMEFNLNYIEGTYVKTDNDIYKITDELFKSLKNSKSD